MPEPFEFDTEEGYVCKAVVRPNGRSPFTRWFYGLDPSAQAKVLAGLKNAVGAMRSNLHAGGRIGKLTDDLDEIRITKKGYQGGVHLRVVVPRRRGGHGQTLWLLTGFKKQTDAIDVNDIDRAETIYNEWSADEPPRTA